MGISVRQGSVIAAAAFKAAHELPSFVGEEGLFSLFKEKAANEVDAERDRDRAMLHSRRVSAIISFLREAGREKVVVGETERRRVCVYLRV